ncbi:MAG: SPW repeat protein [Firmicutes bacterium]|nr:SPW repeat protein [Bacillota bacterium]
MVWQNWVNVILGLWVLISPWVFGFSGNGGALWNNIIIGATVAVLAYTAATKSSNSVRRSA